MDVFTPKEFRFPPFWILLIFLFLVVGPVASYQLGYLSAATEGLKSETDQLAESVDRFENCVGLLDENVGLKAALRESEERRQQAEDAFAKAAFGLGFINSLAMVWEDRNAVREIIIQGLLKRAPLRISSVHRINFSKKALANGDVVRFARLSFADFDGNGYVFPHLLKKMPVGVLVQLPGDKRVFVYDFKENMLYCFKNVAVIPQQNLLMIN